MNTVLFTIAAYLIGSISFAVVVSKAFGLSDPRTYGSKNPGATNVLRSGNKKAAALTLIGDGFKGWLAVWLAIKFGPQFGVEDSGIPRSFVAGVFPLRRRQGSGHSAGHLAGLECLAGRGDAGDLAGGGLRFPLFVAGGIDCQRVRAVLLWSFVRQRRRHLAGGAGDEHLAGVSSPQEHRQSAGGQGKQDRFEEKISPLRIASRRKKARSKPGFFTPAELQLTPRNSSSGQRGRTLKA